MPVTYLHVLNGEIVGEIESDEKSTIHLPPFDGKYCHELIRKDRVETTLKTALSLATAAEAFTKIGLVDKRAEVAPVEPIVKG
jgi:hypothetical protein